MKYTKKLLCCIAMAVVMLSGCAARPEVTEETQNPAVTVTNVDELLTALAPGAEILMEPGAYDLCDASDYGMETQSPYYSWVETYDGYELKLSGLSDVTLQGSGMDETVLSAQPRYANVLILQNCSNITLSDLTAGHTVEPGECAGGVLDLRGCMNVDMNGLGLYGCGINGLKISVSTNIRIAGSNIYDCSSAGIIATDTDGLTVESCSLYDLGDPEYGGYSVFDLTRNTNVQILDCEIRDNITQTLLNGYGSQISISNTHFSGNRVRSVAFDIPENCLVLDNTTFADNSIRMWYPLSDTYAVDAQGDPITENQLEEAHMITKAPEQVERTEVHVANVDEFLAAIAPNTQIILEGDLYDFSTAIGYGEVEGEYYYWEDIFDGPGLVISDIQNFGISSVDGNKNRHTLEAVPRYANVLTFSNSRDITLSGFTAGHTVEPGSCTGGVLAFRDCDNVQVEDCGLYGCGILGVEAEYSGDIRVLNCDIYECSDGGIRMHGVNGVTIEDCTFRDLGGSRIYLHGCDNVTIDGEAMDSHVEIE